ncbi:glutathione S-transferase family protein [Shewanella youngdeokensis]|uniref:Glutathione S-transferase n=1 Tax=Shewanella youngdeokensis TaxID=2999068 RepID=A0ABZ0K4K4_9GAMM|nr:glutathione S-transferase [Shewanella sp. DAU334]
MITVHHLKRSRSKRVIWLLEELSVPYNVVTHQRDPISHLAPRSLQAIHPLGKAPMMVDGDITICESGAILEYILNNAGANQLRPAINTTQYYRYLEWSHFAEGSLSLPVISSLLLQIEPNEGSSPLTRYIAKEIDVDFTYINKYLENQPYFAGESFTAADIMMTIMLEIAVSLKLINDKNNIKNYLINIQKRDAYLIAAKHG